MIEFFAPAFLFEEIEKHLPSLRSRSRLGTEGARELFGLVRKYVVTVPEEDILLHWKRAFEALGPIDIGDVPYLAAALATPCDGIWSDDSDMKRQTAVRVWTTGELLAALKEDGLAL